eukprot:COSAG02_NODE_5409_length_4352_cov_3.033153_8_plen_56_part_01
MQISEITDSAFCKKRARGVGLGVGAKQPNKPKTTASSAGLTTPARCRSCPPTSSPP